MKNLYNIRNGVFYKVAIKPCKKVVQMSYYKFDESTNKWNFTKKSQFEYIEEKDQEMKNAYCYALTLGYVAPNNLKSALTSYGCLEWLNLFERALSI